MVENRIGVIGPTRIKSGWKLGAEFGGTEKNSRNKFSNDLCLGKNFHFNAQNFWWPFLVIVSILSVFLSVSLLSEIWYVTFMTFWPKTYLRTKNSSLRTFLVRSYFASSNNSTSPNIGGRMHGRPPPQILGVCPPDPLSLRPWCYSILPKSQWVVVVYIILIRF